MQEHHQAFALLLVQRGASLLLETVDQVGERRLIVRPSRFLTPGDLGILMIEHRRRDEVHQPNGNGTGDGATYSRDQHALSVRGSAVGYGIRASRNGLQ